MDELLDANAKLALDNRDKDVRLSAYVKQYELMKSMRQSIVTSKYGDGSQRNNDLDSFIAFQQKSSIKQFASNIPRFTQARKNSHAFMTHAMSEITSVKLSVACSNYQNNQIIEETSYKSGVGSYHYKDIEVKSNNSKYSNMIQSSDNG
jgi:hypothetical protein